MPQTPVSQPDFIESWRTYITSFQIYQNVPTVDQSGIGILVNFQIDLTEQSSEIDLYFDSKLISCRVTWLNHWEEMVVFTVLEQMPN